MENEKYELFYDNVKEMNGVLFITIPQALHRYAGIKKGDTVKVWIKKRDEKEEGK